MVVMRIWGAISTTDPQRTVARMNGKIITHPMKGWFVLALISGIFLIAKAMS